MCNRSELGVRTQPAHMTVPVKMPMAACGVHALRLKLNQPGRLLTLLDVHFTDKARALLFDVQLGLQPTRVLWVRLSCSCGKRARVPAVPDGVLLGAVGVPGGWDSCCVVFIRVVVLFFFN